MIRNPESLAMWAQQQREFAEACSCSSFHTGTDISKKLVVRTAFRVRRGIQCHSVAIELTVSKRRVHVYLGNQSMEIVCLPSNLCSLRC